MVWSGLGYLHRQAVCITRCMDGLHVAIRSGSLVCAWSAPGLAMVWSGGLVWSGILVTPAYDPVTPVEPHPLKSALIYLLGGRGMVMSNGEGGSKRGGSLSQAPLAAFS